MLNRVMLLGRLGRDPELKQGQNGGQVATFTVATDEAWTDRSGARTQRTEWHRVVAFQGLAENCARHIGKGSLVFVEGSLQTRKWVDANGQQRHMTEVRAQRVVFLDRRRQDPGEERPAVEEAAGEDVSQAAEEAPRSGEPAAFRRQPLRDGAGRSEGRWWDSAGSDEQDDPYGPEY